MAKKAKPMIDREIRPSRRWSMFKHNDIHVEAERYDCDTPFVHLTLTNRVWDKEAGQEVVKELTLGMTDSETLDLIDRLERALAVLPTSK